MSRRARQRRQWDPIIAAATFARVMTVAAMTQSKELLSREDLNRMLLACRSGVDMIMRGTGTEAHANELVNAVNLATVLADAGLGDEWHSIIDAGRAAIVAMGTRAQPDGSHPGRYVFRGPELQAVQDLLDLHEVQLKDDRLTEGRLMAAVSEIHARRQRGQIYDPTMHGDTPSIAQGAAA